MVNHQQITSRVLVLLLMVILGVHAGKPIDPRSVKTILPDNDIIGDGNCFYRCLSQYLFNDQEGYQTIRQNVINFMSEREDEYLRFIFNDHSGDYGRFLSQHREDGVWAEEAIVQAAADLYGVEIFVSSFGNSNDVQQIVRARSDQRVESRRWLHLRLRQHHYNIITDSFQENALEPTDAVDLQDIYNPRSDEHGIDDLYRKKMGLPESGGGKVIPDDELPEINDPLQSEDDIDNICKNLKDFKFREEKGFHDIRKKKNIKTALFKRTDKKISESERVENLGRQEDQYVELEVEENETLEEIDVPKQVNEVLSSEEKDNLEPDTEVPPVKKPDVIIQDVNHLRQLIGDGQVPFASHIRVGRRRFGMEYYHHYITMEASDRSLTVLHLTKSPPFHIMCDMVTIDFSRFNNTFLDFDLGVELLYKFEIPSLTNESALEAIRLRIDYVLSLDCINYSLISTTGNKMYCASMVSYILTGEKDHTEVYNFINRYNIFAILLILLVECSCGVIYGVRVGGKGFSKLKGNLKNAYKIVKLCTIDRLNSFLSFIICMFNPAVNLWRFLKEKVSKKNKKKD